MPRSTTISVIVPTKDRLGYLKRGLPTYLAQPEVAEVIVVIDGSTDGTVEFMQEYVTKEERVRVLDNGVNKGIPITKNRGIKAATSDYIFIAEDDLELTPGFFTTLLKHLGASGGDIICGRNIFRFDYETDKEAIRRTNKLPGPMVNLKTIELETSFPLQDDTVLPMIAAPMLGRAEIFKKVLFDERYKVNFWREETDFQISAEEAGYKLVSCPHAICYNFMIKNDRGGVHAAIGFKRTRWMIINNWRFIAKHKRFIHDHFDIGNPYIFIAKFTCVKLSTQFFNYVVHLKKQLFNQKSI